MTDAAASALASCRAALPALAWTGLEPRPLSPLAAPAVPLATLRRALARARRPVLLVNDLERAWPRDLPAVLADLWEGCGDRAVLLAATGTHRADRAALVDRAGGLPVAVHDADDAAAHAPVDAPEGLPEGAPRRTWAEALAQAGVRAEVASPPHLDRRVLGADLVVAFGTVEPHWFAGWSGAHKTASVGVMDRASITENHRRALAPGSRPCALDDNPVHLLLRLALGFLALRGARLLAVNQVLDAQARPVALGVGTWEGALARCLPAARQAFVHDLAAPVDVLVARVRGPLGRSLYQAEKGLKNSEHAVRDGGVVVIDAPLDQGVGPDRFVRLLADCPTVEAARSRVAAGYVLGDHKAVRWRALEARGVKVVVAGPGLDPAVVAAAGITVRPTLAEALEVARAHVAGRAGHGVVVDDAALVVVTAPA